MRASMLRHAHIISDDLLRDAHEWMDDRDRVAELDPVVEWTVGLVRRAARQAASRVRIGPDIAREVDMVDLASCGVGLAIALDPECSWEDAVRAGQQELWQAVKASGRHHGYTSDGPTPRFAAYWDRREDQTPAPEAIVGRMALAEVLSALPARHVQTLAIAAWTDTIAHAASAAGITVAAWQWRLRKARTAALALLFDEETAPSLSRLRSREVQHGRICPQGHEIVGDNIRRQRSRSGRYTARCRTCAQAHDARRRAAS